ncbi:hypothetical protein BpHYR1_025120 [Brachionus plicatilis]|uniref:Uncharacterized protein n=1 Tax=Brachionus plicatilis TaxID=10195 RepID=A0A3M7RSH9_BRAPC|nr:hypothetical protein BpHYR1_025120 [Brachionus plicatilis]
MGKFGEHIQANTFGPGVLGYRLSKYSAISSTSLRITASFSLSGSSNLLEPCNRTGGLSDNSLNSLGGLSTLIVRTSKLNLLVLALTSSCKNTVWQNGHAPWERPSWPALTNKCNLLQSISVFELITSWFI